MQDMELAVFLRTRWQRLLRKVGWRAPGLPTWGEGSPTILGVCASCGAVVLKGWHREVPDGLLCRRCAGQESKE